MDYKFLVLVFMIGLSGCVTEKCIKKDESTEGHRQMVGDFPYYHWNVPIVQEVNVPAQILNGVFIPEHKELVLIKPGQWAAKEKEKYAEKHEDKYEEIKADCSNDGVDITCIP